jgi:hypothetical protein
MSKEPPRADAERLNQSCDDYVARLQFLRGVRRKRDAAMNFSRTDTLFLLAEIDARDAALREARAENEKLRGRIDYLEAEAVIAGDGWMPDRPGWYWVRYKSSSEWLQAEYTVQSDSGGVRVWKINGRLAHRPDEIRGSAPSPLTPPAPREGDNT